MDIDITRKPPDDISRHRKRYIRIVMALLGLVGCAVLLAIYAVLSESASGDKLETMALVLFVGPGLIFVYYAEKLQDFKRLTPGQEKELAGLCSDDSVIAAYCEQVAGLGRKPVLAEYEACKARADELAHKKTGRP